MRILAIDASIRSTGYTVLEYMEVGETAHVEALKVERIVTKKTSDENVSLTIAKIVKELVEIAKEYQVDEVQLEDGYVGKNGKTALLLSGLRQSIVTAFYLNGITINTDQPSAIRSTVMGKGSADKREVAEHVQTVFAESKQVKSLGDFCDKGKKKNDDMYDSILIGLSRVIKGMKTNMSICYH